MLPDALLVAMCDELQEMDGQSTYGLRGWLQHQKDLGQRPHDDTQDELAITRSLCERMSVRGLPTQPRRYAADSKSCDIVVGLSDGRDAWIEAKVYYTAYFKDADVTFQ